jgi:uncharacterized protein YbcI
LADWRNLTNQERAKITQAESEPAIFAGIIRFQEEYLEWNPEQIDAHFIKDLLLVRIRGRFSAFAEVEQAAVDQARLQQVLQRQASMSRRFTDSPIYSS